MDPRNTGRLAPCRYFSHRLPHACSMRSGSRLYFTQIAKGRKPSGLTRESDNLGYKFNHLLEGGDISDDIVQSLAKSGDINLMDNGYCRVKWLNSVVKPRFGLSNSKQ